MDIRTADIFVTGGAGTLGRAIARKRREDGWTGRMTVYSTSPLKHAELKRDYPDIQFVQGDIRNPETLGLAMLGHELVIHAAAVKYIPDSEYASIDTFDVNVTGSLNVCAAAHSVGVDTVLGISTDKACHPANTYGASKMLMERVFQEYARANLKTQYKLVRYGNVLESVGSVIETWKKAVAAGQPVKITDPQMTRFWLSPRMAADHVVLALSAPNGCIHVPMDSALCIGDLLKYTVMAEDVQVQRVPLRPGEKLHETLVTFDELEFTTAFLDDNPHYVLQPSTSKRLPFKNLKPFTSETAHQLTSAELETLLHD